MAFTQPKMNGRAGDIFTMDEKHDSATYGSLQYGAHTINTVSIGSAMWFRGNDVAGALGYVISKNAIRDGVNHANKASLLELLQGVDSAEVPCNGNEKKSIYITPDGLRELLVSSKKANKQQFMEFCARELDISCTAITRLHKEQEYIGYIMTAFRCKRPITQYTVEQYRIDLYFPRERVAVECDEFGHRDRDAEYEATREATLKRRLGCRFIRFNPDAADFCIFEVIGQLSAVFEG